MALSKKSKQRIRQLAKRIKQVENFDRRGICYLKKPMPLFTEYYMFDPKPDDKATDLKKLGYIFTYHKDRSLGG